MEDIDAPALMWETRFGWRVDVCAAATYLGGPVTGAHQGCIKCHLTDAVLDSAPLPDTRDNK